MQTGDFKIFSPEKESAAEFPPQVTLSSQAASTGEIGAADTPSSPALPTGWFIALPARTQWLLCRKLACVYAKRQTPDLGAQIPLHESDAKSVACRC